MNRDEYERLKEEEKEHLRELKRLRERLREAERTRALRQAVQKVQEDAQSEEFDDALRSVQEETLESEVRMDMALESADAGEVDPEEERRLRAEALVRQMKVAMGGIEPEEALREVEPESEPEEPTDERTIGKPPRRSEESISEEEPEKTIGRMVRKTDADE
jgi:hypothetical protein